MVPKARAMANANIETRVFMGFLLVTLLEPPHQKPPIVGVVVPTKRAPTEANARDPTKFVCSF